MNDILDENEINSSTNYAENSFRYLLYIFIGFIVNIVIIIFKIISLSMGETIDLIIGMIVIIIVIFSIIGLINGIMSFLKKERSSYKKYIGLIGNLIFVLLSFSILIANFFDISRWFNG